LAREAVGHTLCGLRTT